MSDVSEPTGLRAVIVDDDGNTWMRRENDLLGPPWYWYQVGGHVWAEWTDIPKPITVKWAGEQS